MSLNFEMHEVLCDLRLGELNDENHDAIMLQKHIAKKLVDTYEEYPDFLIYDKWKVNRYRKFAQYKVDKIRPDTLLRTHTVYSSAKWFSHIYRWINWISIDFLPYYIGVLKFVAKNIKYFGINHGTILLFDLSVIIKNILYHFFKADNDKNRKYLLTRKKFLNLLTKDNRANRMAKSFIWLVANICLIVFTGGFSAFVNIGILFLDASISFFLKRRKLKTSEKTLEAIYQNVEYIPLAPYLEAEIKFQKNRNNLIHSIALVAIGSSIIFLPHITIPLIVGGLVVAAGVVGIIYALNKLHWKGLSTMADRFFKSYFGVSSLKKPQVENDPKKEHEHSLEHKKTSLTKIINEYKKQCSILNFYGYQRANELITRIKYAKNNDFLQNEVEFFTKYGKTESDHTRYNFFRSLRRSSGYGKHSLRTMVANCINSSNWETSLQITLAKDFTMTP
jgi:hypothetical protein